MKIHLQSCVLAIFSLFLLTAFASAQQIEVKMTGLGFVDHLKAGMIEQDVFVEKEPGSGMVSRVTGKERETYINSPVFSTASPVHHAPFDMAKVGPYKKGQELGFTLGEWLSGTGKVSFSCKNGTGNVTATFKKLVPNGVYTMWYAIAAKSHMGCPKCPFATLDFPVGNPNGKENIFVASGAGDGSFEANFSPCLKLGNSLTVPMLAIAYHSDGKTYGPSPGPMGSLSHVQLFSPLPDEWAWLRASK